MSLSLATGGATRSAGPNQRTKQPIVTGTSVLAIKYAGGVMMTADTLCSYGSMAKYKDARRMQSINAKTLVGGGGEYSDFQAVTELLKRNALEDQCTADSLYDEDASEECAREVWNYLRAVMYNRRNKMNPLWNDLVVAGFSAQGDPFLGYVDKIGTTYEDSFIATGFGSHLAIPILREKYREDLTEGEARALLEDCMRVLFYRDCRALNRIQIAKVTKDDGVLISDPYEIETNWSSASFVEPKGQLDGDGGW
jgi:20S proteasome subunit beta 7